MVRHQKTLQPTMKLRPLTEEARHLASQHIPLARGLAWKQFQGCFGRVPLDELKGEALFALSYAASLFDHRRDVPFGAYATLVIQHRLIQTVMTWYRGVRVAQVRFSELQIPSQFGSAMEFDTACPHTRESRDEAVTHDLLERVQRHLPTRWFTALQLYYAMGFTLDEVGEQLNVSRERVRQLIRKALDRLRRRLPEHFREYTEEDSRRTASAYSRMRF